MFAKLYTTLNKVTDDEVSKIWASESIYKNNLTLVENSILAIEKKLSECDSLHSYIECLVMSNSDERLICYCGDIEKSEKTITASDRDKKHFFKFEVI